MELLGCCWKHIICILLFNSFGGFLCSFTYCVSCDVRFNSDHNVGVRGRFLCGRYLPATHSNFARLFLHLQNFFTIYSFVSFFLHPLCFLPLVVFFHPFLTFFILCINCIVQNKYRMVIKIQCVISLLQRLSCFLLVKNSNIIFIFNWKIISGDILHFHLQFLYSYSCGPKYARKLCYFIIYTFCLIR